jgi:D-lactate dehydrogenase (cytochrome)
LAEIINASVQEVEEAGIPYFIVGHVGDGNLHLGYLIDPARPEERATAERLSHQMVERALSLDGTCTGEHGIGLHKQGFLVEEAGEDAMDLMRTLKRALDPHDIMNPGKVLRI